MLKEMLFLLLLHHIFLLFALMCLEKNLCLTLDHRFAVG